VGGPGFPCSPEELRGLAHPEWTKQQMIDALRRANPRFGPKNRSGFLRTPPLEVLTSPIIIRVVGSTTEPEGNHATGTSRPKMRGVS
jgi:hypothetical protein